MSFIQIQCKRCKAVFRDRAGRVQDGYTRQCPSCEVVLFFAEDSPHPSIRRAIRDARRARKEQLRAEAERRAATEAPVAESRRFEGRRRAAGRAE